MAISHFHFSIGPVQGFLAQARRTRDFWAGSFLLSWLSGVAMLAVQKQHGTFVFRRPPDDYLEWDRGYAQRHRWTATGRYPSTDLWRGSATASTRAR